MQERYAYSAYGEPIFLSPTFTSRASSLFAWETLYAGYRYDTLTRLFAVRHRMYHPLVGCWLSRDPAGAERLNLLRYVGNRAVTFTDARGLQAGRRNASDGSVLGYRLSDVKEVFAQHTRAIIEPIVTSKWLRSLDALVRSTSNSPTVAPLEVHLSPPRLSIPIDLSVLNINLSIRDPRTISFGELGDALATAIADRVPRYDDAWSALLGEAVRVGGMDDPRLLPYPGKLKAPEEVFGMPLLASVSRDLLRPSVDFQDRNPLGLMVLGGIGAALYRWGPPDFLPEFRMPGPMGQ